MGEDKFFKKGNYEKSDTLFVQHKTCTHVENKIKAEHPKKFKLLYCEKQRKQICCSY